MKYQVTHEEMMEFAKELYREACNGFMDVCDEVSLGMVNKFLTNKPLADQPFFYPPIIGTPQDYQTLYVSDAVRPEMFVRNDNFSENLSERL